MSPNPTTGDLEFRRVQRPTADLPVVHLEASIPVDENWRLLVGGLAGAPRSWTVDEIRSMKTEERVWDLNCVWGWTRPACRWEGVPASTFIDAAQPLPSARFLVAEAAETGPRTYASCLTLAEARESLIALKVDGEDLTPEHGGPVRLIPPPHKWGYKGVKWLTKMTLVDSFQPGFWEEMVGNPVGDIPDELLDLKYE